MQMFLMIPLPASIIHPLWMMRIDYERRLKSQRSGTKKYCVTVQTLLMTRSMCLTHPSPNVPISQLGEQGWRGGESTRLPPMWPRFDSGPVPYVG